MRRVIVAVIGGSQPSESEACLAEEVGVMLAAEGWAVLSGGLGGVMEAASRGAARHGGLVIGILPGGDPDSCNAYVEIAVASGLGDGRNAVIANTADAFVAVGGSFGTLSEIAFALKRNKPVVALCSWKLDATRLVGGEPFVEVSTSAEAIGYLRQQLSGGDQR